MWALALLLGLGPLAAHAQVYLSGRATAPPPFEGTAGQMVLEADSVLGSTGFVALNGWRYRLGDDASWARPDLDDGAWSPGSSHLVPETEGWGGIGWFRARLVVDSALVGVPLGLHVVQAGASEIYLDGELLYRLGTVAADAASEEAFWDQEYPRVVVFDGGREHVLAVRYSNASTGRAQRMGVGGGFYLVVGDLAGQVEERVGRERYLRSMQTFFTAVPLAFALLHLFLFLFYRRLRENLYFALVTAAIAANNFVDLQAVFATGPAERVAFIHLNGLTSLLSGLFGLCLAYHLRRPAVGAPPRAFWAFAAAGTALWAVTVAAPGPATMAAFTLYHVVVLAEILRLIATARVTSGVVGGVIAVGMVLSLASMLAQMLINVGVVAPVGPVPVYYFGVLFLLVTISLLLSARFARTSRALEQRLAEVEALTERTLEQEREAQEMAFARRLLEADNARKTQELEAARNLQLAMLPERVPELPHLEVATFMRTASEVGGDYYDFHVAPDGALTIAIGDATGHGTPAGLMVAAVKGLFASMAEADDLRDLFREITRVIRAMRVKPLYMALQLVRVRGRRLTAVSAGMPYVLLYRAASGELEEVVLKGAPLGHVLDFPYEVAERTLEPGDTVLLLSDGFPELFNEAREMFDYERVRDAFREAASQAPSAVVADLAAAADRWRNGRLPNDDVTFVVLRIREEGAGEAELAASAEATAAEPVAA